jgi:hypothetical protein
MHDGANNMIVRATLTKGRTVEENGGETVCMQLYLLLYTGGKFGLSY